MGGVQHIRARNRTTTHVKKRRCGGKGNEKEKNTGGGKIEMVSIGTWNLHRSGRRGGQIV